MNPLSVLFLLLLQLAAPAKASPSFHWDWRNWEELSAAQSLRDAHMTKSDKTAIAGVIEAQIGPEMSDGGTELQEDLEKSALDTRVKLVHLDRSSTPEVAAQAMADCSPTGNCSFWIFQKTARSYRLLLKGFGQTFTIQKASTNGFRDVVVSMHNSAFYSMITVYRYDGAKYGDVACYAATFSILEDNGGVRELREPRLEPCGAR